MSDTQLFAFEQDFVATLRCIPMAVRLKLDVCGIKLSLRQWSRFTQVERGGLRLSPCSTPAEISAYRTALVALVALRANEAAKPLLDPPGGQWDDAARVPPRVTEFARSLGLAPPSRDRWRQLTRLQRFALIKLTRDKHDNVNFAPAMQEFGMGV